MFTRSLVVGLILAFSLNIASALASTITGTITDSQSGQPVAGAFVKVADNGASAISDTLGNFLIAEINASEVRLTVSVIGYEIAIRKVRDVDFADLHIELTPTLLRGQDVVVTDTRAREGETPAAFSNLTNDDIERSYWSQDTPILLSRLPNSNAYSDAGNGIGYSYLKIRGIDQKRIAVMLNGVPLNDAESHEVFWVDLPDFVSSTRDIQVQRGVGSSLYGASALGGSVNLITGQASLQPNVTIESGAGSYDTRKFSIEGNSGLINDSYSFYGRFSKMQTDGYREKSWTKTYAYFISASRYDENMTWKFNTYGGPEESHLAYKGITLAQLESNRRYNELQYDDEIDHFNQPHYEFLHDWKINEKIDFYNTVYYFSGEGYYNQLRDRRDIEEYFPGYFGIPVSDTTLAPRVYYDLNDDGTFARNDDSLLTILKTDLVRRPTVIENDWGWIPRFGYHHGKGELTLGGEARIHSGRHFGEVIWSGIYPAGLPSNVHYYDFRTRSRTFSVFAMESYKLTDRLSLLANLQYQHHTYELREDQRFDVTFKRHFDYLSPRAGINFSVNPDLNVFLNVSTASRHPALKDIYDPTDYWSNPAYKPDNFSDDSTTFIGKELKPERLLDYEFGLNFESREFFVPVKTAVNLYRMEIRDEILPYSGQIDDMGYPISGNAEKAIHQGVELSLESKLRKDLTLSGNFSVNDDHFNSYIEYGFDYVVWDSVSYDRSGNRIGGFPEFLSNWRLEWGYDDFRAGLTARLVGSQFIDNGETYKIDSYNLFDIDLSYNLGKIVGFKSLLLSARFNNIANKKYIPAGYIEFDDNLPRYIVGADRNFYLSLKASL